MTIHPAPTTLCVGPFSGRTVPGGADCCATAREATARLAERKYTALVLDLSLGLPDAALERLVRLAGAAVIVALLAAPSLSRSMELMRLGVHDVLDLHVSDAELARRVSLLMRRHRASPALPGALARLVGTSPQMAAARDRLVTIAATPDPVFISGAPGSGKSLAAEVLHALVAGNEAPLITVDCAAADAASRLFGTGRKTGAINHATGGVLVLDHIEALPPGAQDLLMRHFRQPAPTPAVRICCLSGLEPLALIGSRQLREDLFYRLQSQALYLPPLRQRTGDLEPLAQHFAGRDGPVLSRASRHLLAEADWPENVRSLRTILTRALAEAGSGLVEPRHLRETAAQPAEQRLAARVKPMWQAEQDIIEAAIKACNGNVTLAAEALHLSPSTLYRKRLAWAQAHPRAARA